ncbi:class I adenylate-forming enzyme family protein [Mycolicibacterium palauense]|uniref:class I adenylate-forming enzyme family protein n=1 Tax=Mycolicibacterium palauense TaxID=2034511 RepID=UPI000BFEC098|nr:AMP-binding protein [Mycolicibacterium palauense]
MAATVGSAVQWWARTASDRAAIIVDEDVLTYRQFHEWSSRLARRLVDDGIKPGQRVGLLAPNSLLWPVAAMAILKTGAVIVPLNARLKAAELRKISDDAGISAMFVAPTLAAAAEDARTAGPDFEILDWNAVADERGGRPDDFRIDTALDDPIAIMFTSGSTGLPKGIILTNQTLLNIVLERTLTEEGFCPATVSLMVLPLAFTPGMVYGVMMTSVLGGTLVIERELDGSRAVRVIEKHSVKTLFGVPLIFEAMAAAPEFAGADLSSLKTAIVGGAAVSPELLQAWADKGVLLRQIYGMTEAGGVAIATTKSEALQHPESCGFGSVFTEVRVVNEDGSPAAPGQTGELVVHGPGVTPGYWDDPATTAQALRNGWLHSGDLGTSDEEGRVTFVDRIKDLIITGGINISPFEIETTIATLDGVAEVAVIAAKDPRFGETPAAIITTTTEGPDLNETAVVTHCEGQLASYKVPRYVVLRAQPLPRLPSGKIAKTTLRQQYKDITDHCPRLR